jgi:hypothetical protein
MHELAGAGSQDFSRYCWRFPGFAGNWSYLLYELAYRRCFSADSFRAFSVELRISADCIKNSAGMPHTIWHMNC